MVSVLFQPEITTLESKILELQAQITAAQQRITALGECELETDGAIQALTIAVQKVSALAPSAIASLKAAVFSLFNSDDGDGGLPDNAPLAPAPTSGLDKSSMLLENPPFCLLEECPQEVLKGQAVEVSCPWNHIKELKLTHKGDGYEEWTAVEPNVAPIPIEVIIEEASKEAEESNTVRLSPKPSKLNIVP